MTFNKNWVKRILFSAILMSSLSSHAVELINWNKTPIKVTVNQGDERMIILDKNISVGLPGSLQNKLRIQSLGGVLYLKSSEPFTETRLMLKDMETGEIILLDVTGDIPSKTKLETIKVVSNDDSQSTDETNQINGKVTESTNHQTLPIPVLLTRYAAQNYYAPLRAIEKVPGVRQISLALPDRLYRLLPRLPVSAMPLSAWRLEGYEVVAIKLINQSNHVVSLDPRLLQGRFYSATFQHNTLGPKGKPTDTTMLYIVTEGRANLAFLPELGIVNQDTMPNATTKGE